jgi:predicted tellurium resistance membrane protein TerC
MLALSFLVMIGLTLVIEGWDSEKAEDLHLKNYVYFGMAFSFLLEVFNMMRIKREKKHIVKLNTPTLEDKKVDNYSDTAH